MRTRYLMAMLCLLTAFPLQGQAVPDDASARKVDAGYRRWPGVGVDPFRYPMIPRWGFVFSAGGTAANNALNFRDIGAVTFLTDRSAFQLGDAIDLFTLVPPGDGLRADGQADGLAYLGLSLGHALTVGVSAGVRSYNSLHVDEEAIRLLRDGNANSQEFSLGESNWTSLVTADAGVHGVIRFGPTGGPDGVHIMTGFGLRLVRPALLVQGRSSVAGGGRFRVGPDSVSSNLGFEVFSTVDFDSSGSYVFDQFTDRLNGQMGSGSLLADLLLRLEWPTSGVALEGMLLNVGSPLTLDRVSRRADTLLVQAASIDSLRVAYDSLNFDVRDSTSVTVTLPRIWRVGASAWANAVLQLDVAASGTLAGDVRNALAVDLGTTWRFLRHLPLRAGVILGGNQGIGYTGGVAIEARNFLLRVSGQTLGGLFETATGAGGRLDFGFFF